MTHRDHVARTAIGSNPAPASGIAYNFGTRPLTVNFLSDVLYERNRGVHVTGYVTITLRQRHTFVVNFQITVTEPLPRPSPASFTAGMPVRLPAPLR